MRTERDYGLCFAEFMLKTGQAIGRVDINKMVGHTVDIPEDDYIEMRRNGIVNPDAREYWSGYNSRFSQEN